MSEHVKQVPDILNHDFIDEVLRDGMGIGGSNGEFAFLDDNLFPELDPSFEELPLPVPLSPSANLTETMNIGYMPDFIDMQPLDSTLLVPVPVVEDAPSVVTITETEAAVNLDSPDVTIEVQTAEEEQEAVAVLKEAPAEGASRSEGSASSDPPKKRGRKRLYPPGTTPPRRRRPRKVKLYELETFEDPEMERKRQNALNAKIHREKQKEKKEALQGQLEAAIRDRDELKRQLEEMREREKKLVLELELIRQQQQHNSTTVFPVQIIL
ncbi:histone-lysine N-methyltransferase, H3 lysine-79 specific-like [Penaeus monodon]|uniref:histone-lysine N-methyltransferase, H3 lysine-79 specific-like n=1 Tax=Penaeus monodon TaxID=6687 RepID=UPI0018A6F356|nr:histone-lysine N-methyltransferase, H3 lysine-79 specific-like [Penaeus monodon]